MLTIRWRRTQAPSERNWVAKSKKHEKSCSGLTRADPPSRVHSSLMTDLNPEERAEPSGEKAPELSLEQVLAIGKHLHRTGRVREAEEVYRAVLARDPNQVDALHFLGLLLHQAGFDREGLELVEKAAALCPGFADIQSNLGNLLRAAGRLDEAVAAYRRAIEADPRHAQALNNLGVVLKNMGRLDEALTSFHQVIELAPERGDAHFNLANLLTLEGREDEAVAEYRQAIEREPSLVYAYHSLSQTLRKLGRGREADEVWKDLTARVPDNPLVKHILAAETGQNVPAQAASAYVQTLFDGFADTFDHVLHALEYRTPNQIAALVARHWPAAEPIREVLDAGCGTGLCGEWLKPYARRLTGVDLSGAMLAKAKRRELYDELVQAELTEFLLRHPASYDLIASADTLVYFGDLRPVLGAAGTALRSGGLLVFSLEDAGKPLTEGYQLNTHGRYSHSEAYVQQLLSEAGLSHCEISKDILRKEQKEPVRGLLVSARKE